MVEFRLPDVGEGMHEGEITNWLIKEGDRVKVDQPVVEVQTDKVNAALSAPVSGVIKQIFFQEGDVVEVGTAIFTIEEDKTEVVSASPTVETIKDQVKGTEKVVSFKGEIRRGLATPYVRQMAREMGIDLYEVNGTGPAGRVTEDDLRKFVKPPLEKHSTPMEKAPRNKIMEPPLEIRDMEERIELKGIRKKIAEHMVKSVSTIPHVTHVDEMHMGPLKELREDLKTYAQEKNSKLTYLPFFIKAIVIALREFPFINASIDEASNEIVLKRYYHIGIATDTAEGLIVPVIKHADKKSIFQIANEVQQLAAEAREGKLNLAQVTGSTFTISNVGPIGGMHATPIINHPEVAILALHKMEPRMVVRDWEGVVQWMMNISLSFDHRIIDGVMAVRFTNRVKELLENPKRLFMELT